MEKTAKRIGIAIVAVLLVALVCAGIALALPGSEAPLSSEGSANALDTAVRSVTVGDTTYDLTDWRQANEYYKYLVEPQQGYTGIEGQEALVSWASANGGNSKARAALKPYTDSGALINYSVGNNSTEDSGYGAVMGAQGIFSATLDGCGAQVELIPNGEWGGDGGGKHSLEVSGSEAQKRLASGNVTMFSEIPHNVSFTGGLANLAVGATLTNLNFVMDDAKEVVSGDKGKAVYMGGLFGAMADTSLNNCSFTLASSADISGTRNLSSSTNTASLSLMAYGGITAYAYNCTVSNTSVAIDGQIWVSTQGRGSVIKYGQLRSFVGGIAAITQGITMYNMTVTGSGTMYADIGNTYQTDAPQNSRAGALVGINMTSTNSETPLHGWNNAGAGTTNINGVLTSYNGSVGFSATTGDGKKWGTWKGILFGSTESGAVTNLYWNGASIPEGQTYCYNQTYTPVAVSASVEDNNGTASVGFANQTSTDIDSLVGLQITYTAPSDSGSILWSYTDSGTTDGEVDMHSDQPYETYTVSWDRKLTDARSVTFTTGRRVKYFVRHDGSDITNLGGMEAEPVKTKPFDNTPYAVPTLQIWSIDGGTNLGEQQNASYWGIFDGEVDSSWDTAVDAAVYNVRLTDAFSSSTKYDFVDNTKRYIAYKSDNSNGASRNYRFEITAREITVSIHPKPEFVYNAAVQNPTFKLNKTVDGDEPQPTVTAQYFNSLGVEIDATQVVNAGDYSVTLTGVDDDNYTVTNLDDYQNYAFSIAKRPITITPSGYEGLTYNGAPQYPKADIGNKIEGDDTQIVNLNYFAASDVNRPINEDERINAGDYQMRAELVDVSNYVLDNSHLQAGDDLTFTDTSVTINYAIGKANLQFAGSQDGTYSFVYFAQPVTTLAALNRAIGGDASPTQYYFQPVDPTNTVDVNVGESGATFTVRKGDSAAQMLDVGTYQVTVSYSSNNFNSIETSFEVVVTPRPLILNFAQDDSYTYSFQYGDAVTDYVREQPQGAQPDDELIFDTVYYKGSVAPENKLDAKPTAVGKYVASYEPTGTGLDLDVDLILGNYTVSPDANSKIEFEITKKDITVAYAGTMSFVYDGTAHSDVSVTSVGGIIDSEQDRYNADTLKVTYTKDGSTADTARNAGTYTVSVAPINAEDTDFANNYNVATTQTFTIDKAPLSLQLLDVTMDYASATGQAIPYGEGVTHNFVEGKIFDGDDVQEDPNEWLLQIYTLNANDGSELTIDGIGTYLFSIRLNPTNSNAGNYELTLTDSEGGAQYPNAPVGVGELKIEGTAVIHGILGTSESGFAVMEEPTEPFAYNIDVTYRGEDIKFSFFTRTTAGSLEGLSFEEFTVDGAVKSGLDETTGYPYVVVRNFGTYTATWTLAESSQDIFFFPNEDGSTSDQNSLTVTINVGKLDAEIVPNDVSVVYGGAIEYAGFSVVGDEDETKAAALAADNVQVTYASTTQSTANIDVYPGAVTITSVTFDGALGDNYNLTYSGAADLTVTPKPITVSLTMSSDTAVYGDELPTATSVTGEFVGEDASAMTALINEQLVYDRNAGVDKVPTLANSAIGNYIVTLAEGTGKITITPKEITGVSVAAGTMPYGGSEANIAPAVDGEFFTENPGFREEDLDKLGLAFRYFGQGELSELEPGEHADALQLEITDEVMSSNYNISGYAAKGKLTVEAMIINEENVEVTLDRDTYDGNAIGYTVSIGGVTVQANDRLVITINGSADTEILNAGEYVFAIEGDGEYYQGTVTFTVSIAKKDISDMDEIGLDKTSATYTGSEIQVSANTSVPVALAITKDGAEAKLVNAGTYTVTVTPTDSNYTGSKTFEFTIEKAPHAKPVINELTIEAAWDSVTVTHDSFIVQLSKDGNEWVDTTMGGYDANSDYMLHVRFKEDDNHSVGGSEMISGKTAERTAVEFAITDKEEHYNRAVLTITFEEAFSGTVKFSIDGGKNWNDLTAQGGKYVASGLAESSEYTLQVKIPAGDDYLESEVKSVKVKTGIDPAKYTETLAMFGETFSGGDLVNYETLKEQFNGLTEADKAGVDAAKFATITAARDAFVASVNSDIEDIQNVAAKTAGRAVAAAAAAVTAAAIALFIAKRKFI